MNTYVFVLTKVCSRILQLVMKGTSAMMIGFGLILNVWMIFRSTSSIGILTLQRILAVQMVCSSIIADGTLTCLITIFMDKISSLKPLEHLPRPIIKIFRDTISCKEDRFKKLFTQDPMTTFLSSSK